MSPPSERERLSELETDNRRHAREIERLREKVHSMSNLIASSDFEDCELRIRKLEASYNKAAGIAAALGALFGAGGSLLARLIGG